MPVSFDTQERRRNIERLLQSGASNELNTQITNEYFDLLKRFEELQHDYNSLVEEKKNIEKETADEKRKFEDLYNNIPISYLVLNEQGDILELNPSAYKLLGIENETLPKEPFSTFLSPDSYKKFHLALNAARLARQKLEIKLNIKGHQYVVSVDISCSSRNDSSEYTYGLILTDLSSFYKVQADLKQNTEKYQRFVENSLDGFILTNYRGQIEEFYESVENISNIKVRDALSHYIWDVYFLMLPPKKRKKDRYERIKRNLQLYFMSGDADFLGKIFEIDFQVKGKQRNIQLLPFSIPTEKGFQLGIIIRDVTEQRTIESRSNLLTSIIDCSNDLYLVLSPE